MVERELPPVTHGTVFTNPEIIGDADGGPAESPSVEQNDQPKTIQIEARGRSAVAGRAVLTSAAGPVATPEASRLVLSTTILRNLGANTTQNNLATAEIMLQATRQQIDLRKGSNDPDVRDLIDFLEWLANGLSDLVDTLRCAVARSDADEPTFLGEAAKIAEDLYVGLPEAVKKHRVRIWEVAGIGAMYYVAGLAGADPMRLLELLRDLLK
jgi:hypothetical protein